MKKKKTVKIVVPQKYEKVLEGVKSDKLDVVDFTNAEMGEAICVGISELVKGTRAKTVKFIRNKLGDDCTEKLI